MKLSTQSKRAAREAYYQTLASQVAGGKMQILTQEGSLLTTLSFPEEMAIATHEGFTYKIPEAEVKAIGDPAKFVVFDSDGHQVLEGTIGVGNSFDMPIEEKDKRLFNGMKFGIEEFSFNVKE